MAEKSKKAKQTVKPKATPPIRRVYVEKTVRFNVEIPASVADVNKREYAEERVEKALDSLNFRGVTCYIR